MKRILGLALVALATRAAAEPITADIGIAANRFPVRPGSTRSETRALPLIDAAIGDRWQLSTVDGLRWTAFDLGKLKLGPVVEYRYQASPDRPADPHGAGDSIEMGLFAQLTTPVAEIETRLRKAINGYRGVSGDVSIDTGGPIVPGTELGLEARLSWADGRFLRSRFGETAGQLREHHYVTAGLAVMGKQRLFGRWSLVGQASRDRLIDGGGGPMIHTRWLNEYTLGVVRHFGR